MVDLPTIPDVVPSLRAPTSGVSPGQIAQPYNEMAANMDKAADVLMKDVAVPLAKKQAANDLINPESDAE
jgi:hypothetical protein